MSTQGPTGSLRGGVPRTLSCVALPATGNTPGAKLDNSLRARETPSSMSARKAFLLGAIVGASVLASVGAVSAGSSRSPQPTVHLSVAPQARADVVPPALLTDLVLLDRKLAKLISDYRDRKIGGEGAFGSKGYVRLRNRIRALGDEKQALVDSFYAQTLYGVKAHKANATPPPATVSISEDDTWAHNPAIGKSNICINIRTTPPQASVSGTITGPGGYKADAAKSPLHADGTAQIRGQITQAGAYTKTLVVYDASGKQTATVTKTFTVAAPPQDGPVTNPPCQKPTQ